MGDQQGDAWDRICAIQAVESCEEALSAQYDEWAKIYNEDMSAVSYRGPHLAAEFLDKQGLSKSAHILDVAAGTGMVGSILHTKFGYQNLDALDGSPGMLEEAKNLGVFKNLYCSFIGGGAVAPIENDLYDAAVLAGTFGKGHLKLDAMDEVIRIVKPGGYIVNVTRDANRHLEEYKDMDQLFAEKEARGEWKKIMEDTSHNYYMEYNALVQVFKVL